MNSVARKSSSVPDREYCQAEAAAGWGNARSGKSMAHQACTAGGGAPSAVEEGRRRPGAENRWSWAPAETPRPTSVSVSSRHALWIRLPCRAAPRESALHPTRPTNAQPRRTTQSRADTPSQMFGVEQLGAAQARRNGVVLRSHSARRGERARRSRGAHDDQQGAFVKTAHPAAAAHRTLDAYSWHAVRDQWLAVYRRVLCRRGKARPGAEKGRPKARRPPPRSVPARAVGGMIGRWRGAALRSGDSEHLAGQRLEVLSSDF